MNPLALYHYTCRHHLPAILASGALTLTESNIGSANPHLKPFGEHVGPDVVWLTEVPNVKRGHGLGGGCSVNKFAIRFTVAAPAIHWPTFAATHGINKKWFRCLDDGTARKWWVCPSEIPSSAWMEIYDMENHAVLYQPSNLKVAA